MRGYDMFPLTWGFLWGGGPSSLKTEKKMRASTSDNLFYTVSHFPWLKGKKEDAELKFLQETNIFESIAKLSPLGNNFKFYRSFEMAKRKGLNIYLMSHQVILVVDPKGLSFEEVGQPVLYYKFPQGQRFNVDIIKEIHIPYEGGDVVVLKNPAFKKITPSISSAGFSSPM